jgi:hypothetical protein
MRARKRAPKKAMAGASRNEISKEELLIPKVLINNFLMMVRKGSWSKKIPIE